MDQSERSRGFVVFVFATTYLYLVLFVWFGRGFVVFVFATTYLYLVLFVWFGYGGWYCWRVVVVVVL